MEKRKYNKVDEGTADNFYQAIHNSDIKNLKRIFTFSSIAERYVLFRYFFDKSKKICMFSRDISLFAASRLQELLEEKCGNAQDIHDQFIKSVKAFLKSSDSTLEILADNITSESVEQIDDEIKKLLINNVNHNVIIKKMNDSLNKVKGINHFILSRDKSMVCFEQESLENHDIQLFSIGDEDLKETSLLVFDGFYNMSDVFNVTCNNC